MDIAVSLFTYNRSYHTKMVLSSLKHSTILPSKLYVFQDGLRPGDDITEWKKVNMLIHAIDWCDTEVLVSVENKGLAHSVLSGVNYAFKESDAVIVLEDDCVPTSNFISYMYQCFEKYKNNEKVYSVSGYSWPIEVKRNQYDIYSCGRISSWGWGTWKDKWKVYNKDYESIRMMKQSETLSRNLAMWGQDLEEIVVGNVRGVCDSWAVFWALSVIAKGGVCLIPFDSFIRNIGMDGSGVHCGITEEFEVDCIDGQKKTFCLPDEIGEPSNETEYAFASFLGSYTAANRDQDKPKVLVYGVGGFFLKNERKINEDYYIERFVDIHKRGYFSGKQILKPHDILNYHFERILIMLQDEKESKDIAGSLVQIYGIPKEKIILGCIKYSV